jgi:hypothetical protein
MGKISAGKMSRNEYSNLEYSRLPNTFFIYILPRILFSYSRGNSRNSTQLASE